MRNNWKTFTVRYWNHPSNINDCFGNSISWVGKARTEEEAEKKARTANRSRHFRLSSCLPLKLPAAPDKPQFPADKFRGIRDLTVTISIPYRTNQRPRTKQIVEFIAETLEDKFSEFCDFSPGNRKTNADKLGVSDSTIMIQAGKQLVEVCL